MLKTGVIALAVFLISLTLAAKVVFGQSSTVSQSATVSPTRAVSPAVSPAQDRTVPSGGPNTGHAE